MLFFIFTSKDFIFDSGLIIYAILFGISYAAATLFSVMAVAQGPLSLTTLIIAYSLMLPTFYGLIFLKDPITVGFIPGLALLVISLILINKKSTDSPPITVKWIKSVVLSFLGNGMCSVFQKAQQVKFDGAYKNEFMILALIFVCIILGFFVILKERKEIKFFAKAGTHLALFCGIANGITNLFVMILSGLIPVSLMFPLISAGGIIVTYVVSKVFFKENLTKAQFIGFILGIASVVFLSI